jgi:hypothetical protein
MITTVIKRTLMLLSLFCICSPTTLAQSQGTGELKWTHFGVRPLAMGNAYVAIADDYNSLFYNPAGLARIKEWDGELLNPTLEVSESTVNFASDMSSLMSGTGEGTDAVLDVLEDNTGKNHHFALGWTPHLIFEGFGMGAGVEVPFSMTVHREISTDVDTGLRAIIPITYAKNIFEGLDVGITVKGLFKAGIDHEFSINDIQAFSGDSTSDSSDEDSTDDADSGASMSDYVKSGYGVGTDIGLLFTPVKTMSPTIGISITDFGGSVYTGIATDGGEPEDYAPKSRLPSVNTGISLKPYEANNMYVTTSMDAHAINQPIHFSKKFNLGVEWGYGSIIKVQSGLHQGELTGGFEFDVFLFTCRFVTYAEQLGTIAGQDDNLRDRRYALQIKLLL